MAVYVDEMKVNYRGMVMCHMLADDPAELHEMADKIGVNRKWFQNKNIPHYDVCKSKRSLAIKFGAIEIRREKTVELIRYYRGLSVKAEGS